MKLHQFSTSSCHQAKQCAAEGSVAVQLPRAARTLERHVDERVPAHSLGEMNDTCGICGSYNFSGERIGRPPNFAHCCSHGKTSHLPEVPEPPDPLRSLLVGKKTQDREFRQQIRKYNSALGFVSLGAQIEMKMTGGPPVFFYSGCSSSLCHHIAAVRKRTDVCAALHHKQQRSQLPPSYVVSRYGAACVAIAEQHVARYKSLPEDAQIDARNY